MNTFIEPYFQTDAEARAKIESVLWPNGPVCHHCGKGERRYATKKRKGVSSHQLMRSLGVTYKSAWFLSMRVREAKHAGGLAPPMSGPSGIVEADETYFGQQDKAPRVSG